MSSEKEIVNYWYNRNGFFTINNIKVSNRDIGILALKFDKEKILDVRHVEVICSIKSNILEKDAKNFVKRIVSERFENKSSKKEINKYLKQFSGVEEINKVLVLSNIPSSRKEEMISSFKEKEIKVLEFEEILGKVIEEIDTQYYKNDVIRTLQLVKYNVLTKPSTFSWLSNVLSSGGKEEFLKTVLKQKEIVKKFKKTDEESLKKILKHVSIKNPEKLAELLQESILNQRTRKPFLDALLKLQGVRKEIKEELIRKEKSLNEFF